MSIITTDGDDGTVKTAHPGKSVATVAGTTTGFDQYGGIVCGGAKTFEQA